MDILSDILRQSFLMFLWVGSVLGILVGAGVLFNPQRVVQVNQYFSRWVGTGKLGMILDRPRWTERFFYRHNRLVGAAVVIGALVVLDTFLFSFNLRRVSALVPREYWWLSDAMVGLLLVGSGLAALIGILVLTRPSILKDLERAANRWISTDRQFAKFNRMNFSAEQTVIRHHRLAGVSIVLGSLYVVIVLGYSLFVAGGRL